ncbi:MAG TPA: serpin family protein, partial [Candidatus Krumholzibacteria bacterium]|nr:serpin family protein [Candidatus Krumholzibacteria bacterium]
FDPAYTRPRVFTRMDETEISVPMMSGEGGFPYDEGDGYAALALPYKGDEVSMLVIVPDAGTFGAFERSLSAARVDSIAAGLRSRDVIVTMPKFSFESTYDLAQTLAAMGMPSAFQPGADFSGIDGTDDGIPWIGWVGHRAFIGIDEYGTLAAAGTGMSFTIGIPPHFDAVRPFIFVIRDHATGAILFLGRVMDPSAS